MGVLIPPELMVEAYLLLGSAQCYTTATLRATYLAKRPMKVYESIPQELRARYAVTYSREMKRRKNELLWRFVEAVGEENEWVRLIARAPVTVTLVVGFIAVPPHVTIPKLWRDHIKPGLYIDRAFIPVKKADGTPQKNLVSKTVYRSWYMYARKNVPKHPVLGKLFNEFKRKETAKGRSEAHAYRLALRDVLRVIVGSAWLTKVFMLAEEGHVELQEVPLPYQLARNPELHLPYMVDPHEIIPGAPPRYTWRALVEAHQRR